MTEPLPRAQVARSRGNGSRAACRRSHWLAFMLGSPWCADACAAGDWRASRQPVDMPQVWPEASSPTLFSQALRPQAVPPRHRQTAICNALDRRAARRVSDMLIHYLELGASRPPGALTPEEAAAGVSRVSRSAQLGVKAGRLMALSDRVLYGEAPVDSGAPALKDQAKALFEALGSVKTS